MPVSKNPYKRFSLIDNAIRRRDYPSLEKIQDLLREEGYPVSVSTLEKDLETMRSKFSMPIVYDRYQRGYAYSDENAYFDIPVTGEDVETIWMALDKLNMFRNASAFRNVRSSLERIMSRLEIDLDRRNVFTDKVIFYEPLPDFAGSEWLASIYDAICGCHYIYFDFHAYQSVTSHCLEPYVLKEYSGRWYVIGRENGSTVLYGLDRIRDLKTSSSIFARDKNFYDHLRNRIEMSLGMFNFKGRRHTVHIGYDNSLAEEIRNSKFTENQVILSEDAQEIVIAMEVVMDEAFLSKAVLPYGDKARIYGPSFAVSMVRRMLIRTLNNYAEE